MFIGGLGLGPSGTALGTTLSQTLSVLLALSVLRRRRTGLRLGRGDLRPDRRTMGSILKIGVPIAFQDGFIQISFIVITVIANRRGLTDAAAVGIVEKIVGALFLVPSAMLSSVSALAAVICTAAYIKRNSLSETEAGIRFRREHPDRFITTR